MKLYKNLFLKTIIIGAPWHPKNSIVSCVEGQNTLGLFSSGSELIPRQHCLKVDRAMGKLLLGTRVRVIFFYLLNQGVWVARLNCV